MLDDNIPKLSCILAMTDSTTSAGWLRKSNFCDDGDSKSHMRAKMHTARAHAARLLRYDIREYSQWFTGKFNLIADSLSRDFYLSDSRLINLFRSRFASQIHKNFKIVQLPEEISCWLCSWLQLMPESQQRLVAHQPSNLEHGTVGNYSSEPWICPTTCSSTFSPINNESHSSLPSLNQSVKPNTPNQEFINWVAQKSEIPSTMWLRPSATINNLTHDWTEMDDLRRFYSTSTKRTEVRTLHQSNRKPYRDVSYHN